MKKQALSNADKQRNWRQRSKVAAAQRIAWVEFLEDEIGPEVAADLRLRFLAQWQFNERD